VSLVVVDASVAAKWFLPAKGEPLTAEALDLFRQYARQDIRFIVPDLFWAELANVLWKAVRLGRFPKVSAETALAYLTDCEFATVPSRTLLHSAFQIATAFERTVYDSLYVALAIQSKAKLITADERLANSLAAHFPVKWLGGI
jgi:predicted nucleic acid-binding protein